MVGFKILKSSLEGVELKKVTISSQTVLVGDLLDLDVGATAWTVAAASSVHFTRKCIAYEGVSTSATEVLVHELTGLERVEVQSANTADASDNGDRMLLTDKNTVNNSGTDVSLETACFIQDGVGSTTTSIVGRVLVGSGVDPDSHTS